MSTNSRFQHRGTVRSAIKVRLHCSREMTRLAAEGQAFLSRTQLSPVLTRTEIKKNHLPHVAMFSDGATFHLSSKMNSPQLWSNGKGVWPRNQVARVRIPVGESGRRRQSGNGVPQAVQRRWRYVVACAESEYIIWQSGHSSPEANVKGRDEINTTERRTAAQQAVIPRRVIFCCSTFAPRLDRGSGTRRKIRPAQGLRSPSRLTARERNADISCALYKGGLEEGVISYKIYTKGSTITSAYEMNSRSGTDRMRNEAVLERVGEERMMLKLIRKRKTNWLGHWLRRNCLLKDALEGMVNGRRVRGRRRYQMIDDIKIYGSYEETKRKAENRKDWRMLDAVSTTRLFSVDGIGNSEMRPRIRHGLPKRLFTAGFIFPPEENHGNYFWRHSKFVPVYRYGHGSNVSKRGNLEDFAVKCCLVDGIDNNVMWPRIRYRLPDIRLTVGEETQPGNKPKRESNQRPRANFRSAGKCLSRLSYASG
ncbi:hypothetical protein ANN_20341 [Periplaneta americana]|uniref:Uncharacterized protein n=1 Tax=Periplaneta americana TaxID=6978 RepID=A0ABQ8SCU1_PERAM|nr:hypothetical protein ANN_20341 [Periplaneta americana]